MRETIFMAAVAFLGLGLAVGLANQDNPPATEAASQPTSQGASGPPQVLVFQVADPKLADQNFRDKVFTSGVLPYGDNIAGTRVIVGLPVTDDVVDAPRQVTLQVFNDDKGTDLGTGMPKEEAGQRDQPVHLSPDLRMCIVKFSSPKVPASGATELHLKGLVTLKVGRGAKEALFKNVSLRLGMKLGEGDAAVTVSSLEEDSRHHDGGMSMSVGLKLQKDSTVKSVSFRSQGRALSDAVVVRDPFWRAANLTADLPSIPDTVDVKVVYYEKVEPRDVPLDMKVRLGQ